MRIFDWRDWRYTTVTIRIRRNGTSKVTDFDCDDGQGGSGGYEKMPQEVKAKVLAAVKEFCR